ncbi:MAG: hypothetical protein KJ732_00400, partial [Candidatus Margulisbacteria bacterium]|nr:hypothetical protein [Candidatus Margulisiibacteriota bacterium]
LLAVELSTDTNFSSRATRRFSQLISQIINESIELSLPNDLLDGAYFLRASLFDGIRYSQPSQATSFSIDTLPPAIFSLEAVRTTMQIVFKGSVNESPAWLWVNNAPVTLETNGSFTNQHQLTPGNNLFTFILSDEAGNTAYLTEEVFYNPASVEISVLSPGASNWFKPDSTIMVDAQVIDLQGSIEDGSEAEIAINGKKLDSPLIYDQEEGSLFGFIALPAELADGAHPASIILADTAGNQSQANFIINIDSSPPQVTQPAKTACHTNSHTVITLPLSDQGAGLDLSGTIIKLIGVSFEGTVSAEADGLVITNNQQLLEGTYEVEVLPRDLVGNTAEAVVFSVIVDTTPPLLTIDSQIEARISQDKLQIEGNVNDKYPALIKVSNRLTETKSFALNGNHFSVVVKLASGNNDIIIEAADQAGNTASETVRTFFSGQTSSKLITSFVHGPNPFSPVQDLPGAFSTQGKGMVFSYALAQPSDIKIRIYDITGTLIWVKELNNASSGVTAWSGIDQFGQITANGIYPYFFSVSANGINESRKGKIVVVK